MAGSSIPIHGVGTGQPTRPDFEGQAHQNVLRPGQSLDIPQQNIRDARTDRENHDRTSDWTSGWARQEQAYAQGAGYEQGGARWNDFSGDRRSDFSGPNFGSVQFDAPGFTPTKSAFGGQPKDWVHAAAMLEERFRADGARVGIDAELKLPGDQATAASTGVTGTGRNNGRRAFTLLT